MGSTLTRTVLVAGAALAFSASTFAAQAQTELVIVKEGTGKYHRPGCDEIRDAKGVLAMTRAQAEGRDLEAHEACDPENPSSSQTAGSPPTVFVYTDSGKHYHKKDCRLLEKKSEKVALAEAGRKLWPCTTCKPPIRKRPPR